MKKIGVITFWNGNENYGQILQCWALQYFLKKEGHSPYVIRYVPTKYLQPLKAFIKWLLPIRFVRSIKKHLLYPNQILIEKRHLQQNERRNFSGFRESYIDFSQRVYSSLYQLQKNPPPADIYIVGSDQVWAQLLSNHNNRSYFLDFGDKTTKRIAYAPSFYYQEYPKELQTELKQLLSNFNAISCREYSGVNICKNLGIDATKVLDPTFLLRKEDYECLAENKSFIGDYIYVYSLNIYNAEEIRWHELEKVGQDRHWKVKTTPARGYFEGEELFGEKTEYIYATPQEWIKLINSSILVVTTSFHGVVLSIILEKPFIYIPLKGHHTDGNSRVLDLLKDLNLECRILTERQSYNQIINHVIDWSDVNIRIDHYRTDSINFLRKAI